MLSTRSARLATMLLLALLAGWVVRRQRLEQPAARAEPTMTDTEGRRGEHPKDRED